MSNEEMCFIAVEFPDDPNVVGNKYWYLCEFRGAEVGDNVIAPLGTHNREQKGIIRTVVFADTFDAPYPVKYIKNIGKLIKIKRPV